MIPVLIMLPVLIYTQHTSPVSVPASEYTSARNVGYCKKPEILAQPEILGTPQYFTARYETQFTGDPSASQRSSTSCPKHGMVRYCTTAVTTSQAICPGGRDDITPEPFPLRKHPP